MNNSIHRISFLVQASEKVSKVSPPLSQYYGQVLTTVAEKTATKLDFTIKRWTCKGCRAALVPGINCTYRLRKKKSSQKYPSQIIKCLNCSTTRSLILHPDRKLKNEVIGNVQSASAPLKSNDLSATKEVSK